LSLADVEESSDDEIKPQSDDSESESDGDNDLQRTRSGRNVKKRVIEGTKKSEKIKERLSAENAQPAQRDDSMGERSTEEESEKENVTKNFQNITIRRKRPRLSTQSSTESKAARKSISKSKSPGKSKPANSRSSKTFGGSRASSKKSASDKNSEEPTSSKRTEKSDSRPSTPVLKRAKRESLAKKANSPARNSSQSTISSGTSGGRPSTPSGGRQTKTAQKAQAVTTRSGRRSGIRK